MLPKPPGALHSSGVVVLNSLVDIGGRNKREFYFLDMTTGIMTTVEGGGAYGVSPDRSRVAYGTAHIDDQDRITDRKLGIADARGQALTVLPWKDEWGSWLSWVGNQRFVFVNRVSWPDTLLVLDLADSSQHLLIPDFPDFAPILYPTAFHPNWDGWFNVMYDPTLTRAVYPRLIPNADTKTYALWDTQARATVATFEDIFALPVDDDGIYPMPHWSPDGSQFVFLGLVPGREPTSETQLELYRVSRDGQTEQLTHLTSIVYPQEDALSWSPDGRYLAMYLDRWRSSSDKTQVAVLDMNSLAIKDFCLSVTYQGAYYGGISGATPIWSPDGTQFLVVDWYEEDHRRVILIDIDHNTATQIAEDMEPIGWMLGAP